MGKQACSRRCFLKLGLSATLLPSTIQSAGIFSGDTEAGVREAAYYSKLPEKKVVCDLCPNACRVADLERGNCGVRENRGGNYYTLIYGQVCARHIDPVEKKPLFHYYPGAQAYSLATAGCNFSCRFCQNWEISQKRPEQVRAVTLPPSEVVRQARENHCRIIAHTYNEPVVFFEYLRDCAAIGKENGIPNVMISNGYIQAKPLREICRLLDAVKIDLKSFSDQFYQQQCGGRLKPVLDTLLILKEEKIWFEIVVLLVPTLNDSAREIGEMSRWIVKELGVDVPLHFSRFFPTYMIRNLPPTPPAVLTQARTIALNAGMKFVYIGNWSSEAENTLCPNCGKLLIERVRFSVAIKGLQGNLCRNCRTVIPGRFT